MAGAGSVRRGGRKGRLALTRHIGIVAVSQEGAALCYRQIFRQATGLLPADQHPRVSLHNEPLSHYIRALQAQDWHAIGDLLRRSAGILARCGAEFCFTPDHAVEHGVHLAETGSLIPWLTMPELVAEAVVGDGRRVVGLIGTKWVTTGATYQTKLGLKGIQVLVPDASEADDLDAIIFNELIFGNIRAQSQRRVLGIIDNLSRRGCEGVIFGCSEAPLLVTPETSAVPIYDASDLLARGAVRRAMEPASR
jgi:aspartate racemase